MASFGTIQGKGVIDDVGRHLAELWDREHGMDIEDRDGGYTNVEVSKIDNPWSLNNIARIKSEFEADEEGTRAKYPQLFYYYDGLIGTKVSQSVHPAGMVISPVSLNDNYGVFNKDGDMCLMLDMDEAHEAGLVKYDFLILKSVKVIRDTCDYLGISYPKTCEVNFDDKNVWESLGKDQSMIFQFESQFAAESLKKFKPQSIFDMSLVTASIRPSGASYRDDLLKRKTHKNSSELIDELLKNNNGLTNSPDIQ